jgi:hypothetical protein
MRPFAPLQRGFAGREPVGKWGGELTMLLFRTFICLVPILAFAAGAARAEGFTPVNKTGSLAYTPVCAATFDAGAGQTPRASAGMHVAFSCHCCGWENWGGHNVCVHQCCN